nr:Chain C, GLU-ARG-LEU-LEU-GLY-GLY-TRP-LYS [Streptococcus pneumoniae R6]
ERLLGGWK